MRKSIYIGTLSGVSIIEIYLLRVYGILPGWLAFAAVTLGFIAGAAK